MPARGDSPAGRRRGRNGRACGCATGSWLTPDNGRRGDGPVMVERALPVAVEQWPDEDTTARGPGRMTGEGKIFSRRRAGAVRRAATTGEKPTRARGAGQHRTAARRV